ncbi:hypothetical protein ACIQ9P_17005 [Kitasatospora sp. NPDC094019]
MIVTQPVLDHWDSDGLDLWPVAEADPHLTPHSRAAAGQGRA